MSDLAPMDAKLSDLDLAALLCSRVCHDVISPVGAIANGLELIDDPKPTRKRVKRPSTWCGVRPRRRRRS